MTNKILMLFSLVLTVAACRDAGNGDAAPFTPSVRDVTECAVHGMTPTSPWCRAVAAATTR